MLHIISKAVLWLLSPANLGLILLLIGAGLLWTGRRRSGRAVIGFLAAAAVLIAVLPLSDWLIRPLEDRFPPPDPLPARVDGILTLGGVVDQFLTGARGQVALHGGVERLTEFVVLARRYPEARLAFSGGSGSILDQSQKEAPVARAFLRSMGLDVSRVVFEDQSRNTHENATLTHRLLHPKPGERWLLITSAMHMPRAVGAFRAAGWEVIPYPVDYHTGGAASASPPMGLQAGLGGLDAAIREWVGLAAYRMLGRTKTLFPGPSPRPNP